MTGLLAIGILAFCEPVGTPTPTIAWDYPTELIASEARLSGFHIHARLLGGTTWMLKGDLPCYWQPWLDEDDIEWYYRVCPLSAAVQRYTDIEGEVLEWGVSAYLSILEPPASYLQSPVAHLPICQPAVCQGYELPRCEQ